MEELRGVAAIDTLERPTLPPLPPAIRQIHNPVVEPILSAVIEPDVAEAGPLAVEAHIPEEHILEEHIPAEPVVESIFDEPVAEVIIGDDVEASPAAAPRVNRKPKSTGSSLDTKKLMVGLFAIFAVVLGIAGVRVLGVLSNTTLVTSLEAGNCIEDFFAPNEGELREVFLVGTTGCENPHAYEVYAVSESVYTETEYPGIDGVFASAQSYCDQQYSSFIGGDFASSPWNVWTFAPTEDRWNDGERTVQCIVGDFTKTELISGSLQNAGR